MTNRDKKNSIRGRMADAGEPFNVARRKVGATAAGPGPEDEDPYQLIEVEVGSDTHSPDRPSLRRHFETFWGRWIIAPDPENTRTAVPGGRGHEDSGYYGVAETRQGRIAVYRGLTDPPWAAGELKDYDTLNDAQMPEDIRRRAAAALGIREVIHRDI